MMILTSCLLWALFSTYFNELSWSFTFSRRASVYRHQQQHQRPYNHRSSELQFMSAVTDSPLQAINNLSISTETELTFRVKEARQQDLASVVSLRVNVFFPEVLPFYQKDTLVSHRSVFYCDSAYSNELVTLLIFILQSP